MKRLTLKLIALGEIVQALVPFVFAGDAIQAFALFRHFDTGTPLAYRIVQFGFYVGVCVLTFVAGVLLLRSRPLGLRLSALAQALQIPLITTTAFGYAVKLCFGIWISCNLDSGFLLFKAALIDDPEFALTFGGAAVAPVLGINVLALGLLVLLRRAMRRERPGYVEPPARPRRLLRFAVKSLLVLLALVLIPTLALWIYNRIDEAPTASAERWFTPAQHTLPDAENAWLYVAGFRAAPGDDPIAFGRRRLDAYEARIAQRGMSKPGSDELALADDPLKFQQNDQHGNKVEFCDLNKNNCLAWARNAAGELAELERANAELLKRYDTLMGMSRADDLSTPSLDEPIAETNKESTLYHMLILRDLGNPAARAAALQKVQRVMVFWQKMESPATNLVMKVRAQRARERYAHLLDALLNESGPNALDSLRDVIDTTLREPGPAQREWGPALRREAQHFRTALDKSIFAGPIDAMRYCESDCLKGWVMAQFYAPQATRNLSASAWDAILEVFEGNPQDMTQANARVAQVAASITPLADGGWEIVRRMSYNATGRILVSIAIPAYGKYIEMQHEAEALRRMVRLKIAALEQRVAARQMPAFLAQNAPALGDPYTGKPFDWDEVTREIRFTPRSKAWGSDLFAVTYIVDSGGAGRRGRHKAKGAGDGQK